MRFHRDQRRLPTRGVELPKEILFTVKDNGEVDYSYHSTDEIIRQEWETIRDQWQADIPDEPEFMDCGLF